MINAVKQPSKIVLLGGTSDIGIAIVQEFLKKGPIDVVLAARLDSPRLSEAHRALEEYGARKISHVEFDATHIDQHRDTINTIFAEGDVDIAIIAFGILPDPDAAWKNHNVAVDNATVNYTAGVSVGSLLAQKFLEQGHGQFIALSSVAGEVIRKSNFAYGSAKAGFDGYFRGLGYNLEDKGIRTLVVRPGQVRTRMTKDLKDAPLTVDPEQVAIKTVDAYWAEKSLIWVPGIFHYIMFFLRRTPTKILKKLPF